MKMLHRLRHVPAVLVIALLTLVAQAAAQEPANAAATALANFTKQVNAYMELHRREEAGLPDIKKGATPTEVMVFEKAMAERIKTARAMAKQGDLFTPDVTPIFKKVFSDYYQRRSGRELRLLFDEVPNFKPAVNLTYPVDAPKANFPPRLALAMPQLPEELEYRLVGTNLVIRDSVANLIVDYLPNIVPAPKR